MEEKLTRIAVIHTQFKEKFGIPRQSGLVPSLRAEIYFEPQYRSADAVRGMEEYSHLWLIWGFSKAERKNPGLTVAPPRLGGKERKGVFATRSPFRPNALGLSSVKLEEVCFGEGGEPLLVVSGADLLDGTPIYDIKPYLPYTDCHPDASGSFGEVHKGDRIQVDFPEELLRILPADLRKSACDVLAQDPRAAYNKKPDYVYGMNFGGYDIRFTVKENVLAVSGVVKLGDGEVKRIK